MQTLGWPALYSFSPSSTGALRARAEGRQHSSLLFCCRMQFAFFHANELCLKLKWEEEKHRVSVYEYARACVCAYLYRQGESSRHIIFPFSFN